MISFTKQIFKSSLNFNKKYLFSQQTIPNQKILQNFPQKPKAGAAMYVDEQQWSRRFMIPQLSKFMPKPVSLPLIQELELYIFSKDFNKNCIETDYVLVKYSLFVLHIWLLNYRLSQGIDLKAIRLKRALNHQFYEYIMDSVYQFQDYFDQDVKSELVRIFKTITYGLDDYYKFDYKERELLDIIKEDILQGIFEEEEDQEDQQARQIQNYLNSQIQYLQALSIDDIQKNHIYWGEFKL